MPALSQVTFRRLGFLSTEGFHYSIANAVSKSGAVVGVSNNRAVYWRADGTIVPLGAVPAPFNDTVQANGVSADGHFVVGGGLWERPDETITCALVGTSEAASLSLLLPIPTGNTSPTWAVDVSDDGRIVVGQGAVYRACRWVDGQIDILQSTGAGFASAISADGTIIAGTFAQGFTDYAFRWTAETGAVSLGDLEGGATRSAAYGMSSHGDFIVGFGQSFNAPQTDFTSEAFLWSGATGMMIPLGDLPGGSFRSVAYAVTDDGRMVVGTGTLDNLHEAAFLWTPTRGIRRLQEVLETDHALDLTGWTLTIVSDISCDGRYVCGTGANPEGFAESFLIDFSVPPRPCPADFNADGFTNSQDFFDYLSAFFTTPTCPQPCPNPNFGCPADFNHDCLVNSADFFDYLTAFLEGGAGCP